MKLAIVDARVILTFIPLGRNKEQFVSGEDTIRDQYTE